MASIWCLQEFNLESMWQLRDHCISVAREVNASGPCLTCDRDLYAHEIAFSTCQPSQSLYKKTTFWQQKIVCGVVFDLFSSCLVGQDADHGDLAAESDKRNSLSLRPRELVRQHCYSVAVDRTQEKIRYYNVRWFLEWSGVEVYSKG